LQISKPSRRTVIVTAQGPFQHGLRPDVPVAGSPSESPYRAYLSARGKALVPVAHNGIGYRVRVLVVDSSACLFQGLKDVTRGFEHLDILGPARTGEVGVELASRLKPDVALLGTDPPDVLLDRLVPRLRAVSPRTRLLLFPPTVTPGARDLVCQLDLAGCIPKEADPRELVDTLTAVAAGRDVAMPSLGTALADAAAKAGRPRLTRREHEILRMAARGDSNIEIAGELFLSPTTVKSYIQSALRKLGVRNRVEAVYRLNQLSLL
jgi:two-component system, NarL family, nitrate/nitrite response regulator NarL